MLAFISSFCWHGNDAIFVIFSVASESPCCLAVLVLLRCLDSSCRILRVCLFCDVETLSENTLNFFSLVFFSFFFCFDRTDKFQLSMSVFPGTWIALFIGQSWLARPGAAGLLFQLTSTLGRHLSLQKRKEKEKHNMPWPLQKKEKEKHNMPWPVCSCMRQSCSRNNVVEPGGKTS